MFGLDFAIRTTDSLVEVRLWDLEVSTVSERLDGEDEGLSGEHGQLTHHLPWVGDKQADILLLADHPLVDVEATREDEVQTHVLGERKEEEEYRANIVEVAAANIWMCQFLFTKFAYEARRHHCVELEEDLCSFIRTWSPCRARTAPAFAWWRVTLPFNKEGSCIQGEITDMRTKTSNENVKVKSNTDQKNI